MTGASCTHGVPLVQKRIVWSLTTESVLDACEAQRLPLWPVHLAKSFCRRSRKPTNSFFCQSGWQTCWHLFGEVQTTFQTPQQTAKTKMPSTHSKCNSWISCNSKNLSADRSWPFSTQRMTAHRKLWKHQPTTSHTQSASSLQSAVRTLEPMFFEVFEDRLI